ncbi:SCO family protein [Bacillaceae bacterium S4-13-56]
MNKARIILLFLFIFSILALSACSEKYEGDFSYEVEPFSFTNQDNKEVSKEDLEGEFWIANMIFTNCNDVCPPMTANMARLQEKLKENSLHVRLVSFSVDPEVDTPSLLKSFADNYEADYTNWDFLTGYSTETIQEFLVKSFKALAEKTEDGQVIHSTRFFLVSPEGNAIKKYDGLRADEMDKIIGDLKTYLDK